MNQPAKMRGREEIDTPFFEGDTLGGLGGSGLPWLTGFLERPLMAGYRAINGASHGPISALPKTENPQSLWQTRPCGQVAVLRAQTISHHPNATSSRSKDPG